MMMKGGYDNWDSLTSAAQERLNVVLKTDVVPIMEEIVKKHIQSDIYDANTPGATSWVGNQQYQRRHVLENNIEPIYNQDEQAVTVTSTATASSSIVKGYSFRNRYPGAFLKLLESGNMGIWRKGFPRPAIGNSQQEIDSSLDGGKLHSAIQQGIEREFNI